MRERLKRERQKSGNQRVSDLQNNRFTSHGDRQNGGETDEDSKWQRTTKQRLKAMKASEKTFKKKLKS